MFRLPSPVTLKLAAGELLAWRQGGVTLRVVSGCAWVTQRGDFDDHFLRSGQAFELRSGARTLISAEQETWLRFECDTRWSAWPQALCRRLIGRATQAATVAV